VIIFVVTIVLAMIDSSSWPGIFFYLTIFSVIVLNMVNGIYQNTVYGLAAKLPFEYTGAVVLGSNLSGTIVSIINLICIYASPSARTAAIYYFITALFILLACFDTYFALPLNRFYRYHEHLYTTSLQRRAAKTRLMDKTSEYDYEEPSIVHAIPYWTVFRTCLPQCFNVFFTFLVTLAVFPAVLAEVEPSHKDFLVEPKYYTAILCFLTFNVCAVVGNLIPSLPLFRLVPPRWLWLPVLLRAFLIPFFLVCNYRPEGVERLWPTLVHWDEVFWFGSATLGATGGYLSSLAMMYCSRSVELEYASTASMFGAASIVTGIFAGIGLSYAMPDVVSQSNFDPPEWWPSPN